MFSILKEPLRSYKCLLCIYQLCFLPPCFAHSVPGTVTFSMFLELYKPLVVSRASFPGTPLLLYLRDQLPLFFQVLDSPCLTSPKLGGLGFCYSTLYIFISTVMVVIIQLFSSLLDHRPHEVRSRLCPRHCSNFCSLLSIWHKLGG